MLNTKKYSSDISIMPLIFTPPVNMNVPQSKEYSSNPEIVIEIIKFIFTNEKNSAI